MVQFFSSCGPLRRHPHLATISKHVLAVAPHLMEGMPRSARGCPGTEADVEAQLPRVIKVILDHHPFLSTVPFFIMFTYY